MAWVPIMGGLKVFSVYFYHTEEWTGRNQQILEAASREIRRCPGLWILVGDFNMEPETFGQYTTPTRLSGVLVRSTVPTFRHGASVRCFDYFVVHHAVACQVREVRVLEESGVSPHHPVQMKLKRSFQGLVARVQVTPSTLPAPIVGCVREPRCWNLAQPTNMDERWTQLMQCTEREILGGCDILGDEARACMGRGLAPRWVIRKVAPLKSYNRPRIARDTRWWRVLSNRLRELWLVETLPTRRPHLPHQPEQIERLRGQLLRMANEAPAEKDRAEIWQMATQEYGEPELQVLKDVHWRALMVLDKLHKRDRRVRENQSRNTRERLPREQRVCSIASRSRAQSGAHEMRRKGRRPTRVMRRNWQTTAGHASGGFTLRSCKMRTGHGRLQTERTCRR